MKSAVYISSIRGTEVIIDADLEESFGIYGRIFWNEITQGDYENATFDFIDFCREQGTQHFYDIGTATGCMALYASIKGMSVIGIEPQDKVHECLMRNLELNPTISKNISIHKALLVSETGLIKDFFTEGANGPLEKLDNSIKTISLQELTRHTSSIDKPAFKIDIEGAEYPLLSSVQNLLLLKELKATVYLSFHPGFTSPYPENNSIFAKIVWRIKLVKETVKLIR